METIIASIAIIVFCVCIVIGIPIDYVEPKCKMYIIPGLTYRHITSGKEVLVTASDKFTRYKKDGNEYSLKTSIFKHEFELIELKEE